MLRCRLVYRGGVATLEELFKGEFGYMKSDAEFELAHKDSGDVVCRVIARLYLAFDEYAKFLSFYVKQEFATPEILEALLVHHANAIHAAHSGLQISMSHPVHQVVGVTAEELPFTGRVILYVESTLDESAKERLISVGQGYGLKVQIRDRNYERFMNEHEKPRAFISHDSRDKPYVERIANRLRGVLCPVWYDEYSLKPGDSLVESISAGLHESKRCVVFLSPNFLSNPGWGKIEFNAAMNKHITEGNVLIPIWHGVTKDEVAAYSSLVVDLFAINTDIGEDEVFAKLHRALIVD